MANLNAAACVTIFHGHPPEWHEAKNKSFHRSYMFPFKVDSFTGDTLW